MVKLKVNNTVPITCILQSIFSINVSPIEWNRPLPASCKDLKESHGNSLDQMRQDIIQVQVDPNKKSFYTKCNQEIENGGWTVVLHRYSGEQDFNCNWNECVKGFGNINGEFFIGLGRLYDITHFTLHELMFVLDDFEQETRIAKYDAFAIEDESNGYMIYLLGNYSGNAGDSFTYHAGRKFSTKDKDHSDGCTIKRDSPGWFNYCSISNVFGKYLKGKYEDENGKIVRGMYWKSFHDSNYALKRITMMIRPINQPLLSTWLL